MSVNRESAVTEHSDNSVKTTCRIISPIWDAEVTDWITRYVASLPEPVEEIGFYLFPWQKPSRAIERAIAADSRIRLYSLDTSRLIQTKKEWDFRKTIAQKRSDEIQAFCSHFFQVRGRPSHSFEKAFLRSLIMSRIHLEFIALAGVARLMEKDDENSNSPLVYMTAYLKNNEIAQILGKELDSKKLKLFCVPRLFLNAQVERLPAKFKRVLLRQFYENLPVEMYPGEEISNDFLSETLSKIEERLHKFQNRKPYGIRLLMKAAKKIKKILIGVSKVVLICLMLLLFPVFIPWFYRKNKIIRRKLKEQGYNFLQGVSSIRSWPEYLHRLRKLVSVMEISSIKKRFAQFTYFCMINYLWPVWYTQRAVMSGLFKDNQRILILDEQNQKPAIRFRYYKNIIQSLLEEGERVLLVTPVMDKATRNGIEAALGDPIELHYHFGLKSFKNLKLLNKKRFFQHYNLLFESNFSQWHGIWLDSTLSYEDKLILNNMFSFYETFKGRIVNYYDVLATHHCKRVLSLVGTQGEAISCVKTLQEAFCLPVAVDAMQDNCTGLYNATFDCVNVDNFYVLDENAIEIYKMQNVQAKQYYAVGWPEWEYQDNLGIALSDEILRSIRQSEFVVGFYNQSFSVADDENFVNLAQELYQNMANFVINYPKVLFLVKPHPSENIDKLVEVIPSHPQIKILPARTANHMLYPHLNMAMSFFSQALVNTTGCGIPSLAVHTMDVSDPFSKAYFKFLEAHVGYQTTNIQDAFGWIRKVYQDKQLYMSMREYLQQKREGIIAAPPSKMIAKLIANRSNIPLLTSAGSQSFSSSPEYNCDDNVIKQTANVNLA